MTIAVFGATGHLGALVVDALLGRGVAPEQIRALGRNAERLAALAERGVGTVQVDMDDADAVAAAVDGTEHVLLVSGSEVGRRVAQHTNVIEAAKAAGVARLVYTSAPHATDTALVLAPEHKATEEALTASGLTYTILRNNWYTENYTGELELARTTGEIANSVGDGRVASAPRSDYAEAAAAVLTTPGHENAVYELGGDTAWTFADFAQAAAEVLGRPVTYRVLTPQEETATLTAAGLDEGTAGFVVALNGNMRDGLLAETTGDLSRLLGRPTTPLADTLRSWL